MSPVSVRLHVPYAEEEKQFVMQAVRQALKTFRALHRNAGDSWDDASMTGEPAEISPPDETPAPESHCRPGHG